MEKFEFKGVWWLPGDEAKRVVGILKFNPEDGADLELMGALSNHSELDSDIVLGKTSDGKDITLYGCFQTKFTFNSSGIPTTVIFANIVFEGAHFNTEEEIEFQELSCRYTHLDEWAWMKGIHITPPTESKLEIKYECPASVKTNISDDYSIEVYPITQTPTYSIVQKEVNITQRIYIKLISNKPSSFGQQQDKLYHIQNFLSLGVGKPVEIIDFMGRTEVNKEDYDGFILHPNVRIYFCTKEASDQYTPLVPQKMLFSLRDIQDDFDMIMRKWFDKEKTLKPVFNLYFGTLYNKDMYLEQRFLSLVQAVESYHRRTRINNEIDPEDHKKRVNAVMESVDDQYKKWIGGRLGYSNEPTLRKRLRELIDECGALIKLSSSSQKKSFINKVCDTRNYLTHYDVSLFDRAAKESELFKICYMLGVIIEFNLLLEIGFEQERAHQLLQEKYKRFKILE